MNVSDDKLKNISEEMNNARHEYSAVIHTQFERRVLTSSEQKVGMFPLKGLSLKENSGVSDTKEKTVRQQASAACFFEDFIS